MNLLAHFMEDLQSHDLQTLILNVMGCVLVCPLLHSGLHLKAIDSAKMQQLDKSYCQYSHRFPSVVTLGELET